MGCSDRSVQKLISASKSLPINTIPRRKVDFGRKNTLSLVDLRGLKRCVLEHPTLPAARIDLDLPMVVGHLSDCRVQEILNKVLKLSSRASAKKPLLANAMKKKRLSFCKQYKDWIEEEWSRVMFSEESMCRINRAASTRVRRLTRSNRFDSGFTVKTVNHSPGLMMSGSFTGGVGRGSLYVVPKGATMNGEGYKEVLKTKLILFMPIYQATHFLQDRAVCHTSKKTKDLLKGQDFEVIDWPANSPDLNPKKTVGAR
jgi:hypothetical protein